VLAALWLAGCATTGGSAGDEGESHDHVAKRELADIATFRTGGHVEAAVAGLDRLLKQLATWGGAASLSPTTRASFDTELEASRAFLRQIGAQEAATDHPLAAEAELARLAPLLGHEELAEAVEASRRVARDAGVRVCARSQTNVSGNAPHLGVLVTRYCAHFGVSYEGPPAEGPATFEVTGAVAGPVKEAGERLRVRVGDWLHSSAWYEPQGKGVARGSVQGTLEASVRQRTVTLLAPYHDRVVTETGTTQQSATLPSPLRAWIDPNSATSVTELDRDYAYEAEEHRGHYELGVKVELAIGATPVTFTLQHKDDLKGYEHDVAFAPAGVEPRHDAVPTPPEWLERQLDRMSTKVVALLNRKFVAVYCAPATLSLDDASRCLAGGQRAPAALAAVARAFGEDGDRLFAVLRPPPPPAPKPERTANPKPKARADQDENPVIE
jgi:hypothetical protein